MRCAVCRNDDGLVVNIIIAEPDDPPQEGCQIIGLEDGEMCDIGAVYVAPDADAPLDAVGGGGKAMSADMTVEMAAPELVAVEGSRFLMPAAYLE